MLPIDHKVCSFFSDSKGNNHLNQTPTHNDFVSDMGYAMVNEVRAFEGYTVNSFEQLVALTGLVALRNRKYDLFFRGQSSDYKDGNGRTVIYPSICRPERNLDGGYQSRIPASIIETRYKQLKGFTGYLRQNQYRARFDEYYYALLQHYEILPTPRIDITQSLRVAATFALEKSQTGYLYVIGLPYPTGSISHFIDQNMVLVKLQNVCPANAHRPRYQEGFLVGRLPYVPLREAGDNLANRLIAKFKLDNNNGLFWNDYFKPLPMELLFPKNDIYLNWLQKEHGRFVCGFESTLG